MLLIKKIYASTLLLMLSFYTTADQSTLMEIYKDPSETTENRVEALLSIMTLEEKATQLQTVWSARQLLENDQGAFITDKANEVLGLGIGHIARPAENKDQVTVNKTPLQTVRFTNAIQRWIKENTRLGIPVIFHEEALHGLAAREATSFPQAIALASTFDPELIEKVYSVAAAEMRIRGGHQALTPILDVARDPRWGRIEETWGEDPYLVSVLGMAAIRGFQGPETGVIPSNKVIATLKHLTGHGEPSGGLNIAPTPVGERTLHDIFLAPFEAAVRSAGARSIMPSYNEIDGIPSHANKKILTQVLRDQWGFDGIVVSDYFANAELMSRHRLASTKDEAAILALEAGVDIEMPDGDVYVNLPNLVNEGKVDIELIDRSVRRVLTEKFRLGLFENPYVPEDKVEGFLGNKEHVVLSQSVAEHAITLLQNRAKVLPLNAEEIKSIAVIGPHVHETLLGGYSDVPHSTVSILQGIKNYLGDDVKVRYAQGTLITKDDWPVFNDSKAANTRSKQRWNINDVELATPKDTKGMIKRAVKAAKKADVAIVVVGENEAVSREAWAENHLGDRTSLQLIGEQQRLVEKVIATGTPTVVVLQNGRPLAISDLVEKADTILETWYLGQQTGDALASVLFGDVSPGGKLPVTIPRTVGHLPVYYNHKPSAKRGYAFDETSPLFPFGFGLSYTNFEYSDLNINDQEAKADGKLKLNFTLKNTGEYDGSEVIQVYINDVKASVTRPVKELKAFKRVTLKKGQATNIDITIPINLLGFHDTDLKYVIEPGEMALMIGSSSADIRLESAFNIGGNRKDVGDKKAFESTIRVNSPTF